MSMEQQLERSEQLLETNEENKRQVERSRQQVRLAQSRVNAGTARVQNCQVQLQQAIAARNAAQQRAASDENGGSVPASYDAAITSAESALSQANRELQEARREQIRTAEDLKWAEAAQQESHKGLLYDARSLCDIARRYDMELSKTAALMRTAEGYLGSSLMESLGAGKGRVNDLTRRIAASLGISPEVGDGIPTGGGHSARGRVRSLTGSGSIHRGGSGHTGGGNTYTSGSGNPPLSGGGQGSVSSGPVPAEPVAVSVKTEKETPAGDPKAAAGANSGGQQGGSLLSRLFGGRRAPQQAQRIFSGYQVDSHGFVHGTNHQAFLRDWEGYEPEKFEKKLFDGDGIVETVDPASIEGIRLGDHDVEDPESFWSQHKRDGTKESFLEVASYIPEVRAALGAGRSLAELLEDERLGTCAALYFDPARMPQVMAHDGFYEFQSNGRHRVLAARELGYQIPVRVIGSRRRK